MKWDRIKGNWKQFKNGVKQRWCRSTESYPACEFDESRCISKFERDQIGLWQNHQESNHRYRYQFKLGERWKLGADLLAMNSPTYNKGRSFIAPIPRLTYDFDAVKLNATYIPRFRPVNDFAVFAIYLTVPLHKW